MRRIKLRRFAWPVLVGLTMAGARVAAQAPPPKPGAPAPQAPPVAPAAQPGAPPAAPQPQAESYTYNPDNRRDPFISLLARGADAKSTMARPPGVPGLLIAEVSVRGIVRGKTLSAVLLAPDTKQFVVRVGDRLFDGTVKAITMDEVVFSQEVNDPLSLIKQKEVRKPLRPIQEGK